MLTLTNFIALLGVLVVVLPLLDRLFDADAKRAIAAYLNPKLRSPPEDLPSRLVSPYDLAVRVQRRIFAARFLSLKFFLRSALITVFVAIAIGVFDATTSSVFRRLLLDAISLTSPQFYFFIAIILAAFVADYLCAGQTVLLLSLVQPTSRLWHLLILLYANFCVSASIFAVFVGLSATVGAFVFDYRSDPSFSAVIDITPNILINTDSNIESNSEIDIPVRVEIDQMNRKVTWIIETPSEAETWFEITKKKQLTPTYSNLVTFSSILSNNVTSSIENVINYETDPCSDDFIFEVSKVAQVDYSFNTTVQAGVAPSYQFHVDGWQKRADILIKAGSVLSFKDFALIWGSYSRDIANVYIFIGQSAGWVPAFYVSPIFLPYAITADRCELGWPINTGFKKFFGFVSYSGRNVSRYDVPLTPFLYAGIGVTVLVHAIALLVALGRYAGALGRLVLPSFPGMTNQAERPFTVIAVTMVIYGIGVSVVYMLVRMIVTFI